MLPNSLANGVKRICDRFKAIETEEGWEVWEKPLIHLPSDGPNGYLVMRVPRTYFNMPGFTIAGLLHTLKQMHENRLANMQREQIRKMRAENDALEAAKKANFERETESFAKEARSTFVRLASETGVTRGTALAALANEKGLSHDEAKKELHRQFDGE